MRPRSGVSLKIATLEGFFAQLRLRLRTDQNCVYGYAVGVESADAAYLRSIGGQFNPANRAYVFGLISRGRILVQVLQIRPDGVLIETTGLLVATEAVEARRLLPQRLLRLRPWRLLRQSPGPSKRPSYVRNCVDHWNL